MPYEERAFRLAYYGISTTTLKYSLSSWQDVLDTSIRWFAFVWTWLPEAIACRCSLGEWPGFMLKGVAPEDA